MLLQGQNMRVFGIRVMVPSWDNPFVPESLKAAAPGQVKKMLEFILPVKILDQNGDQVLLWTGGPISSLTGRNKEPLTINQFVSQLKRGEQIESNITLKPTAAGKGKSPFSDMVFLQGLDYDQGVWPAGSVLPAGSHTLDITRCFRR
jgi:hypothetical protein